MVKVGVGELINGQPLTRVSIVNAINYIYLCNDSIKITHYINTYVNMVTNLHYKTSTII